jgi:hypothetical protein
MGRIGVDLGIVLPIQLSERIAPTLEPTGRAVLVKGYPDTANRGKSAVEHFFNVRICDKRTGVRH